MKDNKANRITKFYETKLISIYVFILVGYELLWKLFSSKFEVGHLELLFEVILRNCNFGMLEDHSEMRGDSPVDNTSTIKSVRT